MNADHQEAFLSTFEQAGVAKVRRAIASDHWPREVHDLAASWLYDKEETNRRAEALEREHVEAARSARDAALQANTVAESATTLARDASITARAASNSAERSERHARISGIIAAAALAVAALIAAAWPR